MESSALGIVIGFRVRVYRLMYVGPLGFICDNSAGCEEAAEDEAEAFFPERDKERKQDNSGGCEEAAEDLISCDTKDCLQTSPAIMRGTSEKKEESSRLGQSSHLIKPKSGPPAAT